MNIGEYYIAASLWDFCLAKDYEYFDWVWDVDNFRSAPAGLDLTERAAFYHHIQTIWLCNLGYWSMRWNINMYRLSLENQPHMPAIEGVLHQRDEDPEELSLICTTFELDLETFVPDGRSHYSMARDRATRA